MKIKLVKIVNLLFLDPLYKEVIIEIRLKKEQSDPAFAVILKRDNLRPMSKNQIRHPTCLNK